MRAPASQSLQRLISANSSNRRIIDGAWNGVEDDVEDHEQDDPSEANAGLFLLTGHGKTSFRAQDAFLLIRSLSFRETH